MMQMIPWGATFLQSAIHFGGLGLMVQVIPLHLQLQLRGLGALMRIGMQKDS